MTPQRIMMLIGVVAIAIALIIMVINSHSSDKLKYIDNIPLKRDRVTESVMKNNFISNFFKYLTTANGKEGDSPSAILKEMRNYALISIPIVGLFWLVGYLPLGIIMAVFVTFYPLIGRYYDKKQFRTDYINDFYTFLNYVILHVSGGVSVSKSISYVESLIDEKSTIKPRLKKIVAQKAISGLSGDTWIESLKILNEGYDFEEITYFIGAAERNQQRGDALSETLNDQLNDIKKRVQIKKRQKIEQAEPKFEGMRVVFGLLPPFLMLFVPVFMAAMLQL